MSTPPLERKVQQLDNDVQSIYELISTIQITQSRHDKRLREVARHLEDHDKRFDAIDGRLDGINGRLDGLGAQLTEVLELLHGR
jgi:chromosome segregation ATPase